MVIPNIEIISISQRFDKFKVIIRSGLNYTLAAKDIAITLVTTTLHQLKIDSSSDAFVP